MARTLSTRPQLTAETVADGVDYSNPQSFGKSTAGDAHAAGSNRAGDPH